jgi:hypothetical protein
MILRAFKRRRRRVKRILATELRKASPEDLRWVEMHKLWLSNEHRCGKDPK